MVWSHKDIGDRAVFDVAKNRRKNERTDQQAHPIAGNNPEKSMPEKTSDRDSAGGAAADQESAQEKEHSDR